MPAASIVKQSSPEFARPRWLQPRAAYIHVPFCAHRCGYCDFATVAGMDQLAERYLHALEKEIANVMPQPAAVETIFIGGGTPTHLGLRQLERLMGTVRASFVLEREAASGEYTVEANPGTLDAEKVAILTEGGVNRISLGAQSFHPDLLRVLERNHNPLDVPRAVDLVRERIREVSLDLIFGVPGQTLEQWQADLQRVLDLGVNHVSTYGLTYEKGTPLWKQRERGEVRPVDEELERAMYEHAMDALAAAGYEHYEISNFARMGHRCRHNEIYWANEAYYGFGLGAARYVHGKRSVNTRDLMGYLAKTEAGESTVQQEEELGPEERARETAVLHLRRLQGIDRVQFQNQTGFELELLAGQAIERSAQRGWLEDDGRSVRLTRDGKIMADSVFQGLL
jgi:oxygen-independent coproporphyrinogen-3 oxidase